MKQVRKTARHEPKQPSKPAVVSIAEPHGRGRFRIDAEGVWYDTPEVRSNFGTLKRPSSSLWLSSPIRVVALTSDGLGGQWGRLLEWLDLDGLKHVWAMPIAALATPRRLFDRLLARGARISREPRMCKLLRAYLETEPVEHARCVSHKPWEPADVLEEVAGHKRWVTVSRENPVARTHAGELLVWQEAW